MTDGTEQMGSTEQIGWTEQMGWTEPTNRNLTDLGDIAEGRYRLAIDQTERGQREYVGTDRTDRDSCRLRAQLFPTHLYIRQACPQSPLAQQPRAFYPQSPPRQPRSRLPSAGHESDPTSLHDQLQNDPSNRQGA